MTAPSPAVSTARPTVIVVANRKGGVLKTSICRSVATEATLAGHDVLLIDGDPQGNLSQIDCGLDTDNGRDLAMALQYGTAFTPATVPGGGRIRVVPGGAVLQQVIAAATTQQIDLASHLRTAINTACRDGLVLIDSGPGETPLLDSFLRVADWLLVPTEADQASLAGLDKIGQRFVAAKQTGAAVQLLGACLVKVNNRATRRNSEISTQISAALGASAQILPPIRLSQVATLDARTYGLSARETLDEATRRQKERVKRLRHAGKPGDSAQDEWWSTPKQVQGLADDYAALTAEILRRVGV